MRCSSLLLILLLLVYQPAAFAESNRASKQGETLLPLTLDEAIQLALRQNTDIKNAESAIQRQRGVIVEAWSFILPQVDLNGEFIQTEKSLVPTFDESNFGTDQDWLTKVEASQALYSGGKGIAYIKQQNLIREAAERELAAVTNNVLFEVKRSFYDVLLSRAQLEVQEESVRLLAEELKSEKSRLAAGTVSEFNVLRAEVALANGKTPLIRARNNVVLTVEELNRVLGVPDDATFRIHTAADVEGELVFTAHKADLEDALAEAERKRPELQRLKLLVGAADKGVDVEWADFLPTLELKASYNVEKSRFSDDLDDTLEGWRAGAEFNWALFDSFGNKARVNQRQADLSVARSNLGQGRLDIEVEVRRAYSSLLESRALVRASSKVVEQAQESLRLAQNRLKAGVSTQLDFLQTQVALTEARSNKVQALHDYNVAAALYKKAVGQALEELPRDSGLVIKAP